jgi:hypothetical protein
MPFEQQCRAELTCVVKYFCKLHCAIWEFCKKKKAFKDGEKEHISCIRQK